jgi:hypothetical protein
LPTRTAAPRLAPRKPHHPLQRRAQPPQPTARIIISALLAFASTSLQRQLPAMSHSVPLRSSDVSCAILPRLGASDAAPTSSMSLSARTAAPRRPHHPIQPLLQPPQAHSTQHHQRIAGIRKHPLASQLPAMSHSVPLRSSDVSCAILPRLGASDAAPSSPNSLSARTRRPSARPSQATTRYSLSPNRLGPQHAASSRHCRRSQSSTHSTSPADGTQRTAEIQRRQLRHN